MKIEIAVLLLAITFLFHMVWYHCPGTQERVLMLIEKGSSSLKDKVAKVV